jgi:hypothetical protein
LTGDPIGLGGGINLYAYGANNPFIQYDIYGLWVWGINMGGDFTGKFIGKVSYSTAILFDSDGGFAVVFTSEKAPFLSVAEGKWDCGLFVNGLLGLLETKATDYGGLGSSVSGSYDFKKLTAITWAVSTPLTNNANLHKNFYELGFSPLNSPSSGWDVGFTVTEGTIFFEKEKLFGAASTWWGEMLYDWLNGEVSCP